MTIKLTRSIQKPIERELWGRAAGRCQFEGCNNILYCSPITQEKVNLAQKAHIYSFSENGPRGRSDLPIENVNSAENLILVCSTCHATIDNNGGENYPAELILQWKKNHEDRVHFVTGITFNKKSYSVFYSGRISEQQVHINKIDAFEAMFPERYPAEASPIDLSMKSSFEDHEPEFWEIESGHLKKAFKQSILPLIEDKIASFSLFALAPMPLLIELGTLFTDKAHVEVYQLKREPKTWKWQSFPENFKYIINMPDSFNKPPVLIISLSAHITTDRITDVLGDDVSIWELTVDDQFVHNDIIRSPAQLSMFRSEMRKLIAQINHKHGNDNTLSIFPAMPVSCSVELGRIRMPKADIPWIIYDQNNKAKKFIKTLTLGSSSK